MVKETTEERLTRARINITYDNPFFAYLSLYLTLEEDTMNKIPRNAGMSVNPSGRVLYRKSFIDGLTDAQIVGVLLHEEMHIALLSLLRSGGKNHFKWNFATDLSINSLLLKNGYKLPEGSLKPDTKSRFIILGKIIDKIDSKAAEDIYDELPNIPEEKSESYSGFDNHESDKGKNDDSNGEPLTESEKQELETEWSNRVQTAITLAQQRGKLPLGMERYADGLKKVEINWRVVLRRFIEQSLPNNQTFLKRAKKSAALGVYLPGVLKDKINIVVGVDTSGSIEKNELTKFLTEIIGVANSFKEVVDMRIMFHDSEVQADYLIKNGSIPQIMAMKIKGGGGTSHLELLEKIKKEVRNCKCLISFTDGYSDLEEIDLKKYTFAKLFIINKKGVIPKINKTTAIFIKLKDD